MALTIISSDLDTRPNYLALSSDIDVNNKIPNASIIGAKVYLTDTSEWKIITADLTLVDYVAP